ncbi:hypothetical protein BU23DRAFT_663826 [Bimuria novae-zelandiae CBS 107.79]|uniref:Gfd2/YDR514C-like C-terminal domain-containing protein n=1 Tax=Bimuria novae-zelandiae CBS 107.79 TaxID=1447943 RepID=A0A6A5UNE1_9PLEO|nr:hypothetical protein BU23DRAFT_663826 [Bimuria novae-zelandiae CBS 107.79]
MDSWSIEPLNTVATKKPRDTVPNMTTSMAGLSVTQSTTATNEQQLSDLKNFLCGIDGLQLVRHFCGWRIPKAPEFLDEILVASLDYERWDRQKSSKIHAITERGITLLRGKDLAALAGDVDSISDADLGRILDASVTYHMRVRETCHMRNESLAPDAEKNSLFATTRFVTLKECKAILTKCLDSNELGVAFQGKKAPVALIGQSLHEDKKVLLSDNYGWKVDLDRFESVVCTTNKVTDLGPLAGLPTFKGDIGDLLNSFSIDLGMGPSDPKKPNPNWLHNAANDTMFALIPALLLALYPKIYPSNAGGFPLDSSISGKSLNKTIKDCSDKKLAVASPQWGAERLCFYCDSEDDLGPSDHDPEECPVRTTAPPCKLCSTAPGKANQKYRGAGKSHRTHRCTFVNSHKVPAYPKFLQRNLTNPQDLVQLSRAFYERDPTVVDELYLKAVAQGRMGDREVEEWAKLSWMDETDEEGFYESYMENPNKDEHHRVLEQAQLQKNKRKMLKGIDALHTGNLKAAVAGGASKSTAEDVGEEQIDRAH